MPAPRATPQRPPTKRGQTSTPAGRRRAPQAGPSTSISPQKRRRRADPSESVTVKDGDDAIDSAPGIKADEDDETKALTTEMEPMDLEKELEHWQDFAVEHYEMVEQLPLELHRNYRLLRELDDGVLRKLSYFQKSLTWAGSADKVVHSTKLQNTIREYISLRLNTIPEPVSVVPNPADAPPLPSLTIHQYPDASAGDSTETGASEADLSTPVPDGQGGKVVPPPLADETEHGDAAPTTTTTTATAAEESEKPVAEDADPDVYGTEAVVEARRKFPSVSPDRPGVENLPPQAIRQTTADQSEKPGPRKEAWKLLPEIARLAREMVKNGEEKVAVAQGAYNSVFHRFTPGSTGSILKRGQIDRHIRALDSALSTQEASILLGLRPNTEPSALVEDPNYGGGLGKEDDQEIVIGLGGGGPRRKGRTVRGRARGRGRGGSSRPVEGHVEALPAVELGEPLVFPDEDP